MMMGNRPSALGRNTSATTYAPSRSGMCTSLSSLSAWYTAVRAIVSAGIFSTPALVVRLRESEFFAAT